MVTVEKQEDNGILATTNSECDCIVAGIDVGNWIRIWKTTIVCC